MKKAISAVLLAGTLVGTVRAVNLAPEAAYSVTLSGYVYPGQVIPGSNTPASEQGFLPAPPWQGPVRVLTDGRRDGPAVVSWFWSQTTKRISVRFDLRRLATVSALRVWPQTTVPGLEAATARIAIAAEALAQAAELRFQPDGEGLVWSGPAQPGRYVEVVCASGQPQMSLAEVEIEGGPQAEVAADAPPPGLLAVAPRELGPLVQLPELPPGAVNLARLPGVQMTSKSSHYDDKTQAQRDDDAAAQSDPTGTALRDGKRTGGLRSAAGWYATKRLQVEVALPAPARVDRIVVWSSGHGTSRSFINCIRLWFRAGEGAAWTPAGEVWNPLLPAEVPAAEYPIVTPPLGQDASALRLELVGVAQSADFMQVGELELWGQSSGRPLVAQPWRVSTAVPVIEPVPTAPLDPAYDWLQRERVRALYGYVGQWQNRDLLDRTVAAGFNCMIVHTMGKSHREEGWPTEVQEWVRVERERSLRVIVSWPFGSDERYGNTQFGAYQPGGATVWQRGPCPLSRGYWERVVGDRAVIAAQAGLTGLVVDMEMYAADSTRYPGPCYCDQCWGRFVAAYLEGVVAAAVALRERPAWIAANALAGDYARWQELEVMGILGAIRERVREANPRFLLGNLLDAESLAGLARGFGTPSMPALVFSELEYSGGIAGLPARLANLRSQGYPVCYIPGLWIKPVTPPRLPELVRTIGPGSGGFWIWSSAAFADNAGAEYAHAEGYSHDAYWQAFKEANAALTAALRSGASAEAPAQVGPRAEVPRSRSTTPSAAEWADAAVLGPFLEYCSGTPALAATHVRALWDGTTLHLWARCDEPQPEQMRTKAAERDDGLLWEQDCLEVFWQHPGTTAYAHVVVTSAGVVADAFSDGIRPEDLGWDAPIETAATRTDQGWELRLRLPLAAAGGGVLEPGTEIRFELARHRPGRETTCWAPTGGMYRAAPNLWGTLLLR